MEAKQISNLCAIAIHMIQQKLLGKKRGGGGVGWRGGYYSAFTASTFMTEFCTVTEKLLLKLIFIFLFFIISPRWLGAMSSLWRSIIQCSTRSRASEYTVSMSRTEETLKPIRLLSLLIGYTHRKYRLRGTLGLVLFLISLLANGVFDYQESRHIYGDAWGSLTIVHVLVCLMSMYCITRIAMPWLERGMSKLEKEEKYSTTFDRIAKVSKVSVLV